MLATLVCAFATFCAIEYREIYDMGYKASHSRDVSDIPWDMWSVPWRAGYRAGGGWAELDEIDRLMRVRDAEEKKLPRQEFIKAQ